MHRPLIVTLPLLLLLVSSSRGQADGYHEAIGQSFAIPEGEWIGEPVRLEDGRLYVACFWTDWCGPCVALFPELAKLQAGLEEDVIFYGVGEGDGSGLRQQLERFEGLQLPTVYRQEGGWVLQQLASFGVQSIPTVVIHDARGRIRGIGNPAWEMVPRPMTRRGVLALESVLEEIAAAPADEETLVRVQALREELALAREFGDTEMELDALASLAALGKPYARYAVERIERLANDDEAWTYGIALLVEWGHVSEITQVLERRVVLPSADPAGRYRDLAGLGPEYGAMALEAFRRTREREAALSWGRDVVRLYPEERDVLMELAVSAFREAPESHRDEGLALLAAEAASRIEPPSADAIALMAEIHDAGGRPTDAIEAMERAVEAAQDETQQAELQKRLRYWQLKQKRG